MEIWITKPTLQAKLSNQEVYQFCYAAANNVTPTYESNASPEQKEAVHRLIRLAGKKLTSGERPPSPITYKLILH